jgi:hypothetical protein
VDEIIGYLIQGLIDLIRNREQKVASPMAPKARPAPPRPPPAVRRPVPASRPPQRGPVIAPKVAPPTFTPRPAPPSPITSPAVVASPAVDAAALRRWLKPGTLRAQFMLTEILQPPVGLRE